MHSTNHTSVRVFRKETQTAVTTGSLHACSSLAYVKTMQHAASCLQSQRYDVLRMLGLHVGGLLDSAGVPPQLPYDTHIWWATPPFFCCRSFYFFPSSELSSCLIALPDSTRVG